MYFIILLKKWRWMRSMLNVEATLGLWLLGNMNNWKN